MEYVPNILLVLIFKYLFKTSIIYRQKLSYSATSAAFNQSTSTAEKSQNAEAAPAEDGSTDTKTEQLSAKEKELLAEKEKLLENVRDLDVSINMPEI